MRRKHGLFWIADATACPSLRLENQFHGELDLAGSIGAGRLRQVCGPPVIGREVTDSNSFIQLNEIARGVREAIIGNRDASVITIEGIECFSD
jgi:hypothetical protein